MEVFTLQRVLGENGVTIWRKANGLDDSPVVPFREQKSMSKETTFLQDTIDVNQLRKELIGMVSALAFDLRKEKKLTSCLTVKIRYSNFDTHTKQIQLGYTNSDAVLTERVLELFKLLYNRRMLIRLIGIKFSKLIYGAYQTDLFSDRATDMNLLQAMDKMRLRYGTGAVMKAILAPDLPQKEKDAT